MPIRRKVVVFTLLLLCTCFSTATAQNEEYNLWADYSGTITYISNNGAVVSKRFINFASNKSRIIKLKSGPDPRQTGFFPCRRGDVHLVLSLADVKEIEVHGDGKPLDITLRNGERFTAQVNATVTHAISYTPRFVFKTSKEPEISVTYFVESNNILKLTFDPVPKKRL